MLLSLLRFLSFKHISYILQKDLNLSPFSRNHFTKLSSSFSNSFSNRSLDTPSLSASWTSISLSPGSNVPSKIAFLRCSNTALQVVLYLTLSLLIPLLDPIINLLFSRDKNLLYFRLKFSTIFSSEVDSKYLLYFAVPLPVIIEISPCHLSCLYFIYQWNFTCCNTL